MTVEEILKQNFIGKKIILERYVWDKKPNDIYNRWAIPGDNNQTYYRKSKDFTHVEDNECLITGIYCDYDNYEGISLAIVVSCGERKGTIAITPFTELKFVE